MGISPCFSCMRVKDPNACEEKTCKRWQTWFVDKWDTMRLGVRLSREQEKKTIEGMVIGGVRYALPHRVQRYFGTDPCTGCQCPKDLCVLPCRIKRDWLQLKNETLL